MKLYTFVMRHARALGVTTVTIAAVAAITVAPFATLAANIFTDGFEAPTNLGNWTAGSAWNSNSSAHSGSKSAHVNGGHNSQTMEKTISTVGFSNVAVSFWYKADDLESGDKVEIFYSTNGGSSWTEITSGQIDHNDDDDEWHQFTYSSFPGSADNNANFKFRFKGDLGNGNDKVWIDDFALTGDVIDNTAPTVTIDEAAGQDDPTDSLPIHFKVEFSESVTGFTASDVLVSGTAGGSNVSVTGSGSSYNVYVNNVAGNGTVIATIPQGAAKDAANNESAASTSTDNQVTYYVNTLPVASDDSVTTLVNTPKNITLQAFDANGNPLTYTYTQGTHGTVTGTGPNVTYTPNTNFADSDSFTFYVNDGYGNSNTATISILVTPVCDDDEHLVNNECVPDEEEEQCDEGYTWNGEYCEPTGGQCDEEATFTVLSDANEEVDGGPELSVETWEHPAWLDESGDGAKWIWSDVEVADPSIDETRTFTDTFTITGTATGGTLSIAADNGYIVTLNGNAVCSASADSSNYGTYQVCNVDASLFVNGENTLSVEVKNLAYDTQDPHTNPAGVIYKLAVNENECDLPETKPQCVPGKELIENGDFEDTAALGGSKWNIFASDIISWLAEWLNPTGAPAIANLEIQEEGLNGWLASDITNPSGTQWTELDSDWGGPASNQSGEAGGVAISQVIGTVPGETYTVSFDFSPRPGTAATQNKVEVLANGIVIGSTSASEPVSPTLTAWTRHSFSFDADSWSTTIALRDAGTPNDSLGTFVDNVSAMCEEPEPTATLVATKIVCTDESQLPNWGATGGPDITSTTAQEWVNTHESCYLAPDWQFQWVTDIDSNTNPGDNILSPASSPWSLFGPTAGDGTITTTIPAGVKVWVREVLKEGFIPFTFNLGETQNNDNDVSAEIYCSTDVLNYDNWDWIDPVTEGETYYCVAFNHPAEGGEQCNPEAEHILLSSDNDGEVLLTLDESGPASLVAAPHANWYVPSEGAWIWKDTATSNEDAAQGAEETFTRTFEVIGTPFDSTLTLAADNSYEVRVNGNLVCADADEHNYENVVTCNIPANYLSNGTNTITFDLVNMDHETANNPSNNPAGLYYKLVVNENECQEPEPLLSTVTMCKIDERGYPLSGWSLYLMGDSVQQDLAITVNNPLGTDSTGLIGGTSYLALASGLWNNSGQSGNWVDAEYSTVDGWVTPVDGFVGYGTNILELQINSAFDPENDWGPYNSAHLYAQSFIQPTDSSANFRIFDGSDETPNAGWYGDNVQETSSLAVDLYKGYAGVTGENGCVTFTDVPYGSYTAGEIMQDGWTHYATWDAESVVDGGAVVVNGETETFTIQNRDIDDDEDYDNDGEGTLIIKKLTSYYENGEFDFDIGGNESFYDADILVNNGTGETSIVLPTGTYSLTETQQDDWEFTSVTCEYEGNSEGVGIQYGAQITIYDGETVTCTFRNAYDEDDGGSSGEQAGNNGPSVLGATTVVSEEQSCGPLLNTYLRLGGANPADEVVKLQDFLNGEMGSGLPLTGVFGPATDAAVRAFQIKYWEDVLQPWFGIEGSAIQDQDDATGYVYKTTKWKINDLWCPGSEALPTLP